MPVYQYRGLAAGNRATRGMVDADSLRAARAKLRSEGIFPTYLAEGRTRTPVFDLLSRLQLPTLRRVPVLDLTLFTNQLATLIGAGTPLVESLAALTDQIENPRLKTVAGQLRGSVNHGSSLADAMGEHPEVFSDLYRSMVRAGEASGSLEPVLSRLADYLEKQMALRNKITSAMLYPVIMLIFCALVISALMVLVIPTIVGLLEDLGQELPTPTLVLMAVSDFFSAWWLALIISATVGSLVLSRAIRTERGRMAWDRFRLRLPVLGRVIRYISIARFSRTLATLLSGGLNIVPGLEIARTVTANAVLGRAIDEAREAITQGATIAGPLRQSGEFPAMVTHMVAVGEASGELDTMLGKVADTYDDLVETALNRLTALMGPLLLIFVASVVVIVLLSTLLPLMNLTSAL
ncbi:MAG: type II secretion system inner membrane protein GspF [Myxococcota bacterium]